MTAIAQYSTDSDELHLYAPHLLAGLASRIVQSNESATGWDQYKGYIDSTNRDRFADATKNAYLLLHEELHKLPETRNLFIGLDKLNIIQPAPAHGWFRTFTTSIVPSYRAGFGDHDVGASSFKIFEPLGQQIPITEAWSMEAPSASILLVQEMEDEITKLEQDIPSAIRSSIREQTKGLQKLSIQDLDSDQELIRTHSVRGLYRFLGTSQCTSPPDLSLSADGKVYARWRLSRSRSVGALFLGGSSVDYALRNMPKKHGGTTTPNELWSLITQLGFSDLIRRRDAEKAA